MAKVVAMMDKFLEVVILRNVKIEKKSKETGKTVETQNSVDRIEKCILPEIGGVTIGVAFKDKRRQGLKNFDKSV
uniref:Uncharacterized protein n=1 Tax=Romanomermis culicivorax TaxID=13658 RepID=A0A915JBR3_ROMCU